jgi:hypothetical protein
MPGLPEPVDFLTGRKLSTHSEQTDSDDYGK